MTIRNAACSCGQLRVTCEGDPVRISVCHCFACQQRTGSVFGAQARFPRARVQIQGAATQFTRAGDSGNAVTFSFCPTCGSTVFWQLQPLPDFISVAIGAFTDPDFPAPRHSVYEVRRHRWVQLPSSIEHLD